MRQRRQIPVACATDDPVMKPERAVQAAKVSVVVRHQRAAGGVRGCERFLIGRLAIVEPELFGRRYVESERGKVPGQCDRDVLVEQEIRPRHR